MKMNILINYPKRGEGGPAFSLELAKGFQKEGHQVYAILVDSVINAEQWEIELPEGHVILLRAHKPGNKLSFLTTTIRFLFIDCLRLRRIFKKNKIDISIRTLYSHWGPMVDKAVQPEHKVAICHDPKAHSGANRQEKLYFNFYHNVDDIFVLTKSFIADTTRIYDKPEDRIHFIPHGRMNMYKVTEKFESLQKLYKKNFHFLFFGRIEEYKGLHVLAKAYANVSRQYPDCELTILGNGKFDEYKDEYGLLSNVHIVNRFINDDEVGNYFALKNTIAIVPYLDATQSGVIPIAFEFGVPVIASDVGGLREQLNDGKLGILYRDNSPEKLEQCMLNAMKDEEFLNKQRNEMIEYRDTLEWDKIAKQFLKEIGM